LRCLFPPFHCPFHDFSAHLPASGSTFPGQQLVRAANPPTYTSHSLVKYSALDDECHNKEEQTEREKDDEFIVPVCTFDLFYKAGRGGQEVRIRVVQT
jgi:hypothetical protein